ncbi:MAG TPA: phosphate signaling complex protein PhoU [Burkholderiales bacterium]|nr:phosphate signaling complex protein PhoU [Burkholderiales bacterium]
MLPESHTSKQFDAELEQARKQVLLMGGLVEQQIVYAIEALRRGDAGLTAQVVEVEVEVNRLEREVDEMCTTVIALRQPNANDLRLIMTMLKVTTDIERIGDEAKKIALYAAQRGRGMGRATLPRLSEITSMADLVKEMLRRALDAFARMDVESAASIAQRDLAVDRSFQSILRELLTYMIEDPRTISASIDVLFVAKALERIGDHAKNITEYVVYLIKGKDVRHVTPEEFEDAVRS